MYLSALPVVGINTISGKSMFEYIAQNLFLFTFIKIFSNMRSTN